MTDSIASELSELRRRVARLEDERAIIDALHRYGQAMDFAQADAWAGLFTQDGVFHCVDESGATILREAGRADLARWARDLHGAATLRLKHCVIAPVVTFADADRARVVSYFANFSENPEPAAPPIVRYMGRYEDDMVRDADGQWRFARRVSISEAPALA